MHDRVPVTQVHGVATLKRLQFQAVSDRRFFALNEELQATEASGAALGHADHVARLEGVILELCAALKFADGTEASLTIVSTHETLIRGPRELRVRTSVASRLRPGFLQRRRAIAMS